MNKMKFTRDVRKPMKTKRLILRALNETDYEAWYDAYVNGLPKQTKWDRDPLKPSLCTKKWFQKIKKEHEDR